MSDIFQNLRANHNRKDSKGKKENVRASQKQS